MGVELGMSRRWRSASHIDIDGWMHGTARRSPAQRGADKKTVDGSGMAVSAWDTHKHTRPTAL